MSKNENVLAGPDFGGLRKDLGAHLLSASDTPACMNAAIYSDVRGVLGPRSGRARRYNTNPNIIGVLPYAFPWDTGRIICDTNGTWTVVSAPAAAGPAFAAASFAGGYLKTLGCSAGSLTSTSQTITVVSGQIQSAV